MMIIDKILGWARGRGYTAVYGSAEQVNEMLTDVDFAASNDATAVVMHLVTDSATVDGKDTAVVAVYFASLCDFDFDGEQLLPEQERLKGIGKELLNDIRTGNEMTYSDPRWQYGYDDYAENVCWVCLRVTLTASAADCVPLSPEPPAPPPEPEYDLFCPQTLDPATTLNIAGRPNPLRSGNVIYVSLVVRSSASTDIQGTSGALIPWIGNTPRHRLTFSSINTVLTVANITDYKRAMQRQGRPMTEETEQWLTERLGKRLYLLYVGGTSIDDTHVLAADSATHFESKQVTVI